MCFVEYRALKTFTYVLAKPKRVERFLQFSSMMTEFCLKTFHTKEVLLGFDL